MVRPIACYCLLPGPNSSARWYFRVIECSFCKNFSEGAGSIRRLKMGATWLRRGLQSSAGHTEDQSPRKSIWKLLNANDERFALAA